MDQPSGIKVVDAEPQQAPNAQASSMNANALLNNTLDGFASLSSRFNPFAQKLNKGLGQVRQVIYIKNCQAFENKAFANFFFCLVCSRKVRYS